MKGILAKLSANSHAGIAEGVYDNITPYDTDHSSMDFAQTLQNSAGHAIISEIKFASPSMGVIRNTGKPLDIAQDMVRGGASAISVLTQPRLFGGAPKYLAQVRKAVNVPILMKDIIVDNIQIRAAASLGADAILLIQALFDGGHISGQHAMIETAHQNDLQVLLEVHDSDELKSAINTDCDMIGVNNRNLDTLQVSLDTTKMVLERYSDDRIVVSESGINDPKDVLFLRSCGASAFLVGSGIMTHDDISEGVRRLVQA